MQSQPKGKAVVRTADLSQSKGVMSLNGIRARNLKGMIWLWTRMFRMYRLTRSNPDCIQIKLGMCSPIEFIQVSYWTSHEALMKFYPDPEHMYFVKYVYNNPDSLTLYNEIYPVPKHAKYTNEPHGLARLVDDSKR